MSLERRYQLVTGGRSFPKMPSALKEVTGRMGGPSPELPSPTPGDEPGVQQALVSSASSAPQCLLARAGCSRLL